MGIFGSFFSKFSRSKATPLELDHFREALIASDIGPAFTEELLNLVAKRSGEDLELAVREQISNSLCKVPRQILLSNGSVTTFLIVGVNGTGKTTSAAKLAKHFTSQGHSVLLAAADTFRAAAVDQLQTWGERIGVPVISGAANSDPAAISFDAASRARRENVELLIIDTAGKIGRAHV